MLIPVRCFTCGKEVSSKWEEYMERCTVSDDKAGILTQLGFKRPCCRTVMLTTVDIMQKILKFEYPQEGLSKDEKFS
ncbi:DNA-directed RNA polymerases I, II, and III subunit RPABC5 [Nematocida minor]|uniref:DNA-directed RNA polymerases I, II, and III subunit RPABC5 n=1 Tax=Nematocida minor TaxID=1912983 RepID=UPI00222033D1|nr:DNA-directed RNA polymerases I, II, and III subunit RPABC5 [Nematocida minor]XP_051331913.1 DNA-directed RNA polymerases I, II, and III subunit RPABC5 [Nematocida minor]KAI5188740.1 DNA-directed RNA polymerases I, II, and III subunit RPABC5 [Nematocida minor]KAI5188747.1 DNA-directed RNA polymerases I, II, and III subunit RPABC5 [Nematocida minor]